MQDALHHIEVGAKAFKNGNYRVAGRMFLKACKEAQTSPGPNNSVLIGCYYNLALFYYHQHQYRKAESTLQRALIMLRDSSDEPRSDNLEIKIASLLIDILKTQGKYRKALRVCKRVIERIDTKQSTICSASHLPIFDRLLSLYLVTNNEVSAEKWLQKVIEDERKSDCPDSRLHIDVWSSRLAWVYCSQGLVDAASRIIHDRSKLLNSQEL